MLNIASDQINGSQNNNKVRSYLTPVRMAIIKNKTQ